MLGQIFKANNNGWRVKPSHDDIVGETCKPVDVKYPARKAEATFNTNLFGQTRHAIDETENENQTARINNVGMHRAAAQSGQSFHSASASVVPPPAASPITVDHHLEKNPFLQKQAEIAELKEVETQQELTTKRARAEDAVVR